MPYVSRNYASNPAAPQERWVCAPTSRLGPFDRPPVSNSSGTDLCGQCVSYVKVVCPGLPQTALWRKGAQAKAEALLPAGTVIATFNARGVYEGHAAIYVGRDATGLLVWDQYVRGTAPKPVGPRRLRYGAHGVSNDGDGFYVVE